ncbi:MAG TPA: hypothetical protein VG015_07100 [Candidatus Dormibacteraeota bacterium]|nr:hypothetical protein [Candidatus Dormibacteraeota bacterium]
MADHDQHRFLGEPDEDLVAALEPDQLVVATHQAFPRRLLSRRVQLALWILRIFTLLVAAAVVYAFVVGLLRH